MESPHTVLAYKRQLYGRWHGSTSSMVVISTTSNFTLPVAASLSSMQALMDCSIAMLSLPDLQRHI